jgi:beta-phosphoglucomutase-like phosphatase (HAD superfamily)
MKGITRNRRLTPEEAAKYETIRQQVAEELPDLVARHHERLATLDQLQELLRQLKAAREEKGTVSASISSYTTIRRRPLLVSPNTTGRPEDRLMSVEPMVSGAERSGERR